MGFSAPKPDPKIAQQQEQQAAQAKAQKISLIQGQLENEDQVRARLYGAKAGFKPPSMFANFGTAPAGQDPGVTAGLRSMFGAMYGGRL